MAYPSFIWENRRSKWANFQEIAVSLTSESYLMWAFMSGLSNFLEKQKHINTNLTSWKSPIQGSLHFLHSRQENPLRNQPQSAFSLLLIISKLATFWVRLTKRKRKKEGNEKRKERRKEKEKRKKQGEQNRDKKKSCSPACRARGNRGRHPGLLVHS